MDTRAKPPASDPLRGQLLDGRYRIGSRIARGGMASVYEALDTRLDRTVAVKIMHPGLADASPANGDADAGDFAARFVREAKAAAKLSHPNVVAVYDQGTDGDTVYLVMELVAGHTLRDVIHKESPVSPARAFALMEPVISALAGAHRAGLIHRDIKPENVLIADDGRVKVADFGLARAVNANTQHTATQGVLIGTVSYLAPELVTEGIAGPRADVYSVGVVLYELLTGKKPHEGESPIQVAYRHVHHDVPAPSALVPGLPDFVDALVGRATSRDRDLRPADAGVLLHQVHRVVAALNAGVRHDPELAADLAPAARAAVGTVGTDTTPEQWDDAALGLFADPAAQPQPQPAHTSMLEVQPLPPPPRKPPRAARTPKPPRQPRQPRQRRSRRGPILLVLALVLALALGGGAFWYGWARYVDAPSVVGLDQADAEQRIEAAGFEVEFAEPVYDSDVPTGAVVTAEPGGGERLLKGDTITLTLSLGKLLVPKVRGLNEDDAQDLLLARQLEFGKSVGRWSEKQPEGTILGSRPKARTELKPGDTVDLIISKGRRPIKVGKWVGKDVEEARAALEKRNLALEVASEEYSDDVPLGRIISQSPESGTLHKGDVVSVVVSKGPELVEVPPVVRFGVDAAESELRAAGFDVVVKDNPDFHYGLGFVVRTDPKAGEMVPKGSTITLYVV